VGDGHPGWTDLVDPTAEELKAHLPASVNETALEALLAPHVHDDEPRPKIESRVDYEVAAKPPQVVGKRLRELRQHIRGIRRTLAPTRDAAGQDRR